ncbi:MAG: threonine/serine dehydratase [Salaquimonas sp.]
MIKIPCFEDIQIAAKRIEGVAVRTPLLQSALLNELTKAKVYLKPEILQRTGSFKFRGAYNAISALSDEEKSKGVMAVSSGNHAQGIAEAARLLGVSATIIMPADSPAIKLARTKRSGAKVITYDRFKEDREKLATEYLEKHNCVFIHPYESFEVIAGQGTAGLEICEDLNAMNIVPDHMLVCSGGGGLTAGINLAMQHFFPKALVHSCEPDGFDDYRRSLELGERVSNTKLAGSVCDAIVTQMPGEVSFAINNGHMGEGLVVTDEEALKAVAFAFNELKLVVEPGGAVALASLIRNADKLAEKTVVITLSGGNIDPEILAQALQQNA